MRQVPQIKAAYDWMIGTYQGEVSKAMATSDTEAVERLEETRDTLERGVFVMLFGQFEKSVTEYFEQARDTVLSTLTGPLGVVGTFLPTATAEFHSRPD